MDRLSPAQRDLVAENTGLVGAVLRANGVILRLYREAGLDFDDAFQDGCVALMRAATRFDPARGRFSTYACLAVARHLQRCAAVASRRPDLRRLADGDRLPWPSPAEPTHQIDVDAALAKLREGDRALLTECDAGGSACSHLARRLGVRRGTLHERLRAARRRLRRVLEGQT